MKKFMKYFLLALFWLLALVTALVGSPVLLIFGCVLLIQRRKKKKAAKSVSPVALSALSAEPDAPVPFGYKTAWLAVQTEDGAALAALLGGHQMSVNWATGLPYAMETEGAWFVSPPLDGWTLAIGVGAFSYACAESFDALRELAAHFPSVQFFASHRVSDGYGWARFENGKCLRAYCLLGDQGEVVWDEGGLTQEECALGLDAFPRVGEEWSEETRFPTEEDMIDLAGAWGIDPRFETRQYPNGVGIICE